MKYIYRAVLPDVILPVIARSLLHARKILLADDPVWKELGPNGIYKIGIAATRDSIGLPICWEPRDPDAPDGQLPHWNCRGKSLHPETISTLEEYGPW